ncbi:MFS transporter [Desertibacillus haloalkaliphilus]|uniref:MFS transporter n=1 Tax=Desertibacillus haloalkaliphilus TaxID=1328930 RepID=UPI001C26F4BA|nr:MFS transporter [Desertibacillus haloalkaliphilus]MBU8905706.1 MFS transporter [Desertibacillus haloalkaliphilus]
MRGKGSSSLLIVVLGLLPFVMVLGNSMLIPILPNMQEDMNITSFQSGLILTVFSIPAALMIPIIGFLSDRIGRKIVVIVSLSLVVIGSILSALAGTMTSGDSAFQLVLVSRVIQGIGAGGTAPLAMVMIADLFEGKVRSKALGSIEVFNGIAKVISPILGALAAIYFWYSAFYLYSTVALIVCLCIWFFIEEGEGRKSKERIPVYMKRMIHVLKREFHWLMPVFIAGGIGLFLLFGMLFYLSYEIERIFQMDGFLKGSFFAIPLGALTIVSFWTGRQIGSDIEKGKRFMFLGLSILSIGFACLIFFHQLYYLILFLTIASIGLGLFLPCANTLITSSVDQNERGLIVSFYGMVRFLGVALGPMVFSLWMEAVVDMFIKSLVLIIIVATWNYFVLFPKPAQRVHTNK